MVASKIKIKKVCEWCGQEYYALKVTTRFCCKKCNDQAYKAKMRKTFLDDAESEFKDKTIREPLRKLNEKISLTAMSVRFMQRLSEIGYFHPSLSPSMTKVSPNWQKVLTSDPKRPSATSTMRCWGRNSIARLLTWHLKTRRFLSDIMRYWSALVPDMPASAMTGPETYTLMS